MIYHYRVVHSDGNTAVGKITSESPRSAMRQLRRQGLNVVELRSPHTSSEKKKSANRQPGQQEVLVFMHQLCTLLESGISLEETVASLAESAGHPFLSQVFGEMTTALRRGESFSKALKDSKMKIPDYFYPLAEAGEFTGKMSKAIRRGVTQWEYSLETSKELRNALTYPSILVASGMGAVLLIFTMVIPRFTFLLEKGSGTLPWLSRIVLECGVFFNQNIKIVGLVAVCTVASVLYSVLNENIRRKLGDFCATVPFFRDWLLEIEIANWASMLGTLLENKVSLLHSLELAQQYVKLSMLRGRLSHVSQAVRNGKSLAEALMEVDAVTSTGHNLIRVGEKSGTLPEMLLSLATLYTQSWRNRVKTFLVLLEPVAILSIGTMIGVIMAAVIMAITSVNNISI